jgi:recombination protein RecA
VSEVYGPESSGKTTLAIHVLAEAQSKGDTVAFIDAEHAFDPKYAQNLGINIDDLIFSQPDSGEQALGIVETLVESGLVDAIVVDSVSALVPQVELDGEMGQSHVGLQARLMSQAMRKLTSMVQKNNTALIFINQIREKVGVSWGNPETTSGGRALRFYASIRIDIRRIGAVKDGDEVVGNKTRVRVKKNKVAPPFKSAEFEIIYGKGINLGLEKLNRYIDEGKIVKAGSWYRFNKEPIAQGQDSAIEWLLENEDEVKNAD